MSEEGAEASQTDAETSQTDAVTNQPQEQLSQIKVTVTGTSKGLRQTQWHERLFVAGMLVTIVVMTSFSIYRLSVVKSSSADFTFGIVLIINAVFCTWYAVEGVKKERPSEIFVQCLATSGVLLYLIINYTNGIQTTVKLVRLIIAWICGWPLVVLGAYIGWKYHKSGYLIFRTVGASSVLQSKLSRLYWFQDFLKFDLQLEMSMVVFVVVSRLSLDTKEIVILSFGLVFTVALFLLGYISFYKEFKIGAIICFALTPVRVAYIIYKFWDVSSYISDFPGVAGATIACGCLALLVRGLVIFFGILIFRDFGSGIKEKLEEKGDGLVFKLWNSFKRL